MKKYMKNINFLTGMKQDEMTKILIWLCRKARTIVINPFDIYLEKIVSLI